MKSINFVINLDVTPSSKVFSTFDYVFILIILLIEINKFIYFPKKKHTRTCLTNKQNNFEELGGWHVHSSKYKRPTTHTLPTLDYFSIRISFFYY